MSSKKTTYIPEIFRRALPEKLPIQEAIESFGKTEVNYNPSFWDLEYCTCRYLNGLSDQGLLERYRTLVYSMQFYLAEKRAVTPIESYQSAWYWYRKEHHTRLEFAIRDLPLPTIPINSRSLDFIPETQVVPNGNEVLLKYGKQQYMRDMVDGLIRFSPAESYEGDENNDARRDEELHKHRFQPGAYTRITTEAGKNIPVVGDIKHTVSRPNYHLFCLSCVWDEELFEAFDADSCVIIADSEQFLRRVADAGRAIFPNWYFYHNPVEYFDPFEHGPSNLFSSAMSKDFRFAYQYEYRLIWQNLRGAPISGHQFLDIGNVSEIMKLYNKSGKLMT